MPLSPELIQKYNKPVPRYTSYPTVPFWENNLSSSDWETLVKKAFQLSGKKDGVTLYIHLPFCESLCTYCGCNKRITKNHNVEDPYLEAIVQEWSNYLGLFEEKPKLAGIHLGGGTPTFFSPQHLVALLTNIIKSAEVLPDHEFSFEGHPNNTTFEHLQELAKVGFDRVSFGVQDFDQTVQQTLHRIQPYEKVKEVTQHARSLGYSSVNFDLIYGLPHQTIKTIKETFDKVASLQPERIAFYSYAHLPEAFPAQKSFESFLPKEQEKRALYEFGKEQLIGMGYEEVGMDHFALPGDLLSVAKKSGSLHRNFMGYTTSPSEMLIGLGASSISDIGLGYAQNEKKIEVYQESLRKNKSTLVRGHAHTKEDRIVRSFLMDLICRAKADVPVGLWEKLPQSHIQALHELEGEGLLEKEGTTLTVHAEGMAVVRNICSLFDLRMIYPHSAKTTFSKAI